MSNLFLERKRPTMEQKIMKSFMETLKKGEILYKSKDYLNALEEYKEALNYLNNLYEEYPKIYTVYLELKCLFHMKKFGDCLSLQEKILEKIKLERNKDLNEIKGKQEMIIKIEAKIDIYTLLINFIYGNSSQSVICILKMKKNLLNESKMTLEEKIFYFYYYLKSFIQISGITKTNKFLEFKEKYDLILKTIKNIKENSPKNFDINGSICESLKKLSPTLFEPFKELMNTVLKKQLYELLDNEYYLYKYGLKNDKVINFFHKFMYIYVQEKNKKKLLELSNAFVFLEKIDLKSKFNMTMEEMIYSQKIRIEEWDIIFRNLNGGMQFFKNFNEHEKKLDLNKSLNDFKILKLRLKTGTNNIMTYRGEKSFNLNFNKSKEITKKENPINSLENCKNDIHYIKLPINNDKIKIPNKSIFSDLTNKMKVINTNIFRKKKLVKLNFKITKNSDSIFNKNNLSCRYSYTNNKIHFPHLINSARSRTNNTKLNISDRSPINKNKKFIIADKKKVLNKIVEKIKIKNINKKINKDKVDVLRNLNNILMDILINIYTPIYKIQNNLVTKNDNINYNRIFPKKIDLYKEPKLKKMIKSYYYKMSNEKQENHNSFFYYENFLLVQNLIFMGICKSKQPNGEIISDNLSILLPCYIIYIIIEDDLRKQKKEINKEIYYLSKIEENSKDFKDMFLLKYFLYKFNTDIKNISLFNGKTSQLTEQINEAFKYSFNDIKTKFNIKTDNYETNILSCFFINKMIYIFHSGYYQMIIGKYDDNLQKWEAKEIIEQSDLIKENITYIIKEKKKSSKKKKKDKNNISKSISEIENSQNSENNKEEDEKLVLSKYKIEKNEKIIVIGCKGLFNNLSNDEIMNSVGYFYNNNKNAKEAATYLIGLNKKKLNNFSYGENNSYDENAKIQYEYKQGKQKAKVYYNDIVCIIVFLE